uniref:Uncharacterized protein n=1 Tax=Heterorhabditis bacteriophora TaxID=37862 RepID=A0A1I7WUN8_HETBA
MENMGINKIFFHFFNDEFKFENILIKVMAKVQNYRRFTSLSIYSYLFYNLISVNSCQRFYIFQGQTNLICYDQNIGTGIDLEVNPFFFEDSCELVVFIKG